MKASLKTRKRNMFQIRVSTGSRTKLYFATLLHNRNYDGKLEMDHDDQKLEIKVIVVITFDLVTVCLLGNAAYTQTSQ